MRILLAEDEPALANWLVQALSQSGFQVDWVNNGRLVASSLKATRYDALVLDLGLPGRDGHDVLEGLRDGGHGLPVLILTARDSLMERVHTLRAGADDAALDRLIAATWQQRSDRYSQIRHAATKLNTHPLRKIEMSYIGG